VLGAGFQEYLFRGQSLGRVDSTTAAVLDANGTVWLTAPGGAPAATAIATGEVQLGILTLPSAMSYVQAGKAKIIGVLSKERPSFLKDQPTIAEGGMLRMPPGEGRRRGVEPGTPLFASYARSLRGDGVR